MGGVFIPSESWSFLLFEQRARNKSQKKMFANTPDGYYQEDDAYHCCRSNINSVRSTHDFFLPHLSYDWP